MVFTGTNVVLKCFEGLFLEGVWIFLKGFMLCSETMVLSEGVFEQVPFAVEGEKFSFCFDCIFSWGFLFSRASI